VTAASGSPDDIQAAVNQAIQEAENTGEMAVVIIPEGTWTFEPYNTGRFDDRGRHTGVKFIVPDEGLWIKGAGLNGTGHPKTILQMPAWPEAQGGPDMTSMFFIIGGYDVGPKQLGSWHFGGKLRISYITFIGRPEDGVSTQSDDAIWLESCKDFRVDHCDFYWMGGVGVGILDHWTQIYRAENGETGDPGRISQGVVDHCNFYDIYKDPIGTNGYGVGISRSWYWSKTPWEENIWKVMGTAASGQGAVYVEDCYFKGTRHAVSGNNGGVYCLRNSIIEDQWLHEAATTGHPCRTDTYGMRAHEIYNNTIKYTGTHGTRFRGIHMEGGGGLVYDNIIEGTTGFPFGESGNLVWAFHFQGCEAENYYSECPICSHPRGHLKDMYVWDNQVSYVDAKYVAEGGICQDEAPPIEGVEYFTDAVYDVATLVASKSTAAGYSYQPFQYPHPLTIEGVTAASGYWSDIQAAVNQVAAAGGGNVYIPEGTFNFVEDGEWYYTSVVNVPAGVNIFGASNPRDANGHVLNDDYKTVLVLPWNAPGNSGQVDNIQWFRFYGSGDPSKPSRFSDIKLIGYRSIDPNARRCGTYDPTLVSPGNPGGMIPLSEQCDTYGQDLDPDTSGPEGECVPCSVQHAIRVEDVIDMRIDHCYFENTCGKAVMFSGTVCRGVIDHCKAINTYGRIYPYDQLTAGYGFYNAIHHLAWDDNIYNVVGHYTDYTIFIEDCYLSHWRHTVVSNYGSHIVFRHNVIEDEYGWGSYDAHGGGSAGVPTLIGTRAVEVYNNKFINPDPNEPVDPTTEERRGHTEAMWIRGGGGAIFNNIVTGSGTYPGIYDRAIYLSAEAAMVGDETIQFTNPHDIYIWNNNFGDASMWIDPKLNLNLDYFFEQMPLPYNTIDTPNAPGYGAGLTYDNPYPYPHPLTLGEAPSQEQVSISGKLVNKLNQPLQANIIVYNLGTTQIKTSDTTSDGNYDLSVSPNTYDLQYSLTNFFIENFFIKLSSLNIASSISNVINYVTNINNQNVSFITDITDTQIIQTYSPQKPQRILINGTPVSEVSSYSQLTDNTWFYDSTEKKLYVKAIPSPPAGYCGDDVCQATEDCSSCPTDCGTCPLVCGDGTPYEQCSSTKPLYCDNNGNLINYCTQCDCPSGQTCNTTTETCYSTGYIFSDDFESGNLNIWTGTWTTTGETVTVVTTDPYQGTYHLNAKSDGSSIGERSAVYKNIAAQGILYMQAYVKFKQVPDSSGEQVAFFWFYNIASGRALAQGHLDYSGGTAKWGVNYNSGPTWTSFTSTTTANATTWYSVELYWKKGSTDGLCKLYVNGIEIVSITGKDTDDFGDANRVYVGDLWDNFAVENYIDNAFVDETYIGP
jgi:hypothetical protein